MSQVAQKQAVYLAVISVFTEHGIKFEEGQNASKLLSKDTRAMVSMILVEGFKSGSIQLDREYNESGLKAYVSGLMSNWLRKDTRLNGGVAYVAKNPGSRTGSSDPTIKAMRALLATLTTDEDKAEVQAEIDKHLAQIAKSKAPSIDFSSLPEHLRSKFSK